MCAHLIESDLLTWQAPGANILASLCVFSLGYMSCDVQRADRASSRVQRYLTHARVRPHAAR